VFYAQILYDLKGGNVKIFNNLTGKKLWNFFIGTSMEILTTGGESVCGSIIAFVIQIDWDNYF